MLFGSNPLDERITTHGGTLNATSNALTASVN
ncbi:hypothetical protein F0726_02225 [Acidithiobacillus caldus]|nr:hypothetical protein F0726_02225 [Acidithiobacillus caldus]